MGNLLLPCTSSTIVCFFPVPVSLLLLYNRFVTNSDFFLLNKILQKYDGWFFLFWCHPVSPE